MQCFKNIFIDYHKFYIQIALFNLHSIFKKLETFHDLKLFELYKIIPKKKKKMLNTELMLISSWF